MTSTAPVCSSCDHWPMFWHHYPLPISWPALLSIQWTLLNQWSVISTEQIELIKYFCKNNYLIWMLDKHFLASKQADAFKHFSSLSCSWLQCDTELMWLTRSWHHDTSALLQPETSDQLWPRVTPVSRVNHSNIFFTQWDRNKADISSCEIFSLKYFHHINMIWAREEIFA